MLFIGVLSWNLSRLVRAPPRSSTGGLERNGRFVAGDSAWCSASRFGALFARTGSPELMVVASRPQRNKLKAVRQVIEAAPDVSTKDA